MPYVDARQEQPVQKYRDVLKRAVMMEDDKAVYLLLGIENQNIVHCAMPVRTMVYDALQYAVQIEETASLHRKQKGHEGHSGDEYLSGFYKNDSLMPVIRWSFISAIRPGMGRSLCEV